jgi:hypothetical protein
MRDRAPTKPNRYAVYDDAHNFLRYEYHERADEPTQLGTALSKANLLSDATENAIWGSTGNRTVDAALSRLKTDGVKIATGSYVGTGTYGEANPCSLTFDFVPWLVYVYCSRSRSFFANDITYLYELSQYDYFLWIYNSKGRSIYSDFNENNTSWNGPSAQSTDGFFNLVGNTLGWFVQSTAASYQLNTSGFPYSYTVIGI